MAQEMEQMFAESNEKVEWESAKNHVRCYAHKLGLVVKHGLNSIGLAAGHIKPTTPPNTTIPIPSIVLNEDMTEVVGSDDSDDEIYSAPLSHACHDSTSDVEDGHDYDYVPSRTCVVVQGATKVRFFIDSFPLPLSH
jgi:hypothetical protein